MSIFDKVLRFIALGFFSGLCPKMPGTAGTLVGVALFGVGLSHCSLLAYVSFLLVSTVLGVLLCGRVAHILGIPDYSGIVWDEMVGIWWVFLLMVGHWIPQTGCWMLVAFVLFRLFDIWKPWPIRWVEQRCGGGLGIMLDDLMAAVYTSVAMGIIDRFLGSVC